MMLKERKKKMGIVDKIKNDAKKAGSNKGKFIFIKDGEKKRVRFLQDMEEGFEATFHDNFNLGVNVPCQEMFGRKCPYCDEEELRTRTQYVWSVWDYDAAEVKLFMYPMNNCSPLGALVSMYETYGTLLDRDYVISVTGKQQNKSFGGVPMDKEKFRNQKAKAISKSKFLEILDKAYPDEHSGDYEDDEEEETKPKKNNKSNDDEIDYSELSAKELYNLCEERDIEAEPKMKPKYYIELLEEYDEENSSGSDEDWDDEEEEVDYSEMSLKELYNLCEEKGIEAEPKKPAKYYINLLKENEKAHEDWDDTDEDEDEDW